MRGEIADRFLAGVIDYDPMSGLDQPPRHVRAHVAETDEPDFHVGVSFPKSLVVMAGR
jgi:hypothetical protein